MDLSVPAGREVVGDGTAAGRLPLPLASGFVGVEGRTGGRIDEHLPAGGQHRELDRAPLGACRRKKRVRVRAREGAEVGARAICQAPPDPARPRHCYGCRVSTGAFRTRCGAAADALEDEPEGRSKCDHQEREGYPKGDGIADLPLWPLGRSRWRRWPRHWWRRNDGERTRDDQRELLRPISHLVGLGVGAMAKIP